MEAMEAPEILNRIKKMRLGEVNTYEGYSGKVCVHKCTGGTVRIFHAECTQEAMVNLIAAARPTTVEISENVEGPNG